MVRPDHFGFNIQTAASNAFQSGGFEQQPASIAFKAKQEFDAFVETLLKAGVDVLVFEEHNPQTPDAVFANNWNSIHPDGKLVLYPMLATNRRPEIRPDIVDVLYERFEITETIDLSGYVEEERYLEGTGSIIFDHINRVAYANRSPRTSESLFMEISKRLGYEPVIFNARDKYGQDIYHTNVLMALGNELVVICLESLPFYDRKIITDKLNDTGHEIIDISFDQLAHFAGNMIELSSREDERLLVMSKSAYDSLSAEQLSRIGQYAKPVYSDIYTIETYGGGSARCMIASIHAPIKKHFPG